MDVKNLVSISMDDSQFDNLKSLLTAFETALDSFTITIEESEKLPRPRLGDRNRLEVEEGLNAVQNHPALAAMLDVNEWKKDYELFSKLTTLNKSLERIQRKVANTAALAGHEALMTNFAFYQIVKMARKMNMPGANDAYEALSQHFENRGNSKAPSTTE